MQNAISYLNSLGLYKVKPGLGRILKILEAFENPHDKLNNIIIAGTNGKGSVAATIASILQSEGYKIGLYTSPHLLRVSERIRVNGKEIPLSDLCRWIDEIKRVSSNCLPEELSYFELLTALAFLYFSEEKVDCSVVEVGMGGRLDATNIVNPIVSVITNVFEDHTQFLGKGISKIAYEKAGIIKNDVPVITGAKGVALNVISSIAKENSTDAIVLGQDFRFESETVHSFNYRGEIWNFDDLTLNLKGYYQFTNATLAIATLENVSRYHGIDINESSIRTGLIATKWEGRMEYIRLEPPMILDGAHNPSAAFSLTKSLKFAHPGIRFVFLIGMLTNKDHENFIEEVSKLAEKIMITDLKSERFIPSENLALIAKKFVRDVEIIKDLEIVFKEFHKTNTKPLCITGSLYLVGAIKNIIS